MDSRPVSVGSTPQLFLDNYVIDRTENVTRQLHRPSRASEEAVIKAERPWELGSQGPFLFGGTAIYDDEDRVFKMWYRANEALAKAAEGMREVVAEDGSIVRRNWVVAEGGWKACYAVSDDGVHWARPDLGITDYRGSKRNNILPSGVGEKQIIRRPSIIKDYEDPDPNRRYKMVYVDQMGEKWGLSKAYSGDGLHWRMNVGEPAYFEQPVIPHGALFGWDPRIERYVHYSKKPIRVRADVDGREVGGGRSLVRSTSRDFESWGETREIIQRAEHDPPLWVPGGHGVLFAILYTEDLYVGLVDAATSYYVEDVPAGMWELYGHQQHQTELLSSRDGIHWDRLAPHWDFITPGPFGAWDSEHIIPSKPIVLDDEILVYYTGSNLPCASHVPDHPQRPLVGKVVDGTRLGYAIGLARLRLDGFVSIDGYEPEGTLTTAPLTFAGDHLVINARAPEKPFGAESASETPFGRLRVELLDTDGHTVAGYSAAENVPFTGDSTRHVVTWRGRSDLGRLAGGPIRLRFYLRNAALYSFQFVGDRLPKGRINRLAPGARGRA